LNARLVRDKSRAPMFYHCVYMLPILRGLDTYSKLFLHPARTPELVSGLVRWVEEAARRDYSRSRVRVGVGT
jgi:hypothetical protein